MTGPRYTALKHPNKVLLNPVDRVYSLIRAAYILKLAFRSARG